METVQQYVRRYLPVWLSVFAGLALWVMNSPRATSCQSRTSVSDSGTSAVLSPHPTTTALPYSSRTWTFAGLGAPGQVKVIKVPAWAQPKVQYGICVVTKSANQTDAQAFVNKVMSKAGQAQLLAYGFLRFLAQSV